MRLRVIASCIAIAAVSVACGKSPEQTRAEEVQKSAEDMAKGFADMAKGLGAMAGNADQKAVEPVSFRDLQTAFGDFAGWQKGTPTGERMTVPVNYSEAKITYTKGDAEVEIQISDSAFNQLLLAPLSMFLTSGYEKDTGNGYERSTKIGEFPGWEKWDAQDKSGELNVVVNRRFIVQVSGHGLSDAKILQSAMGSVDLKRLVSLK